MRVMKLPRKDWFRCQCQNCVPLELPSTTYERVTQLQPMGVDLLLLVKEFKKTFKFEASSEVISVTFLPEKLKEWDEKYREKPNYDVNRALLIESTIVPTMTVEELIVSKLQLNEPAVDAIWYDYWEISISNSFHLYALHLDHITRNTVKLDLKNKPYQLKEKYKYIHRQEELILKIGDPYLPRLVAVFVNGSDIRHVVKPEDYTYLLY